MSTMLVTLSPLLASVALPLAGNCKEETPRQWSQRVWCNILPSVVAVLCLAQRLSSTRGKRTPPFRRKSPLIYEVPGFGQCCQWEPADPSACPWLLLGFLARLIPCRPIQPQRDYLLSFQRRAWCFTRRSPWRQLPGTSYRRVASRSSGALTPARLPEARSGAQHGSGAATLRL